MHNSSQAITNFSDSTQHQSKRIYFFGTLGTLVEWYDFAIYATLAPIFAHTVFMNKNNSLLMVYSLFFISYLARPLGGLFYGFIGDYYGRKPALLLSIFMMTLCMFAIMLLPNWQMKGNIVPILFITFRIIQSLSVGGETVGALIYVLESVGNKRRGTYGGTTWAMLDIGILLATLTMVLLTHTLNQEQLYSWGWRIPYLIGGTAGLVIFALRMTIPESTEFYMEKQRLINKEAQMSLQGFSLKLKEIFTHYKLPILSIIGLLALMSSVGSFIYGYFPTYLHQYFSISMVKGWEINAAIVTTWIIITMSSAVLSDRVDRRKLLMASVACFLIFSCLLLHLLSIKKQYMVLLVAFLFGVPTSIYKGALPPILVSLAPLRIRYTVFALGYNIAVALFAGSAPLICSQMARLSPLAPAFYFMALAALALITLYFISDQPAIDTRQLSTVY